MPTVWLGGGGPRRPAARGVRTILLVGFHAGNRSGQHGGRRGAVTPSGHGRTPPRFLRGEVLDACAQLIRVNTSHAVLGVPC